MKENATPSVATARRVPLALKEVLKIELDNMVKSDILEPVEDSTDWVHRIVIVSKRNGKIRICMDPRSLNKYIKREHYTIPTVEATLAEFNGATTFSALDASSAFLQVQLNGYSSNLCTIATPYGRYRYKTMPYGLKSAPEVFQKIMNAMD